MSRTTLTEWAQAPKAQMDTSAPISTGSLQFGWINSFLKGELSGHIQILFSPDIPHFYISAI